MDTIVSYSLDGITWNQTRSRNISVSGILVHGLNGIQIGQTANLDFQLPNLRYQNQFQTEAQVVRMVKPRGHSPGFALKFSKLTMGQYLLIDEFVARVLGLPGDSNAYEIDPLEESSLLGMERLARETAEQIANQPEQARASVSVKRRAWVVKHYKKLGWIAVAAVGIYILYYIVGPITALILKMP